MISPPDGAPDIDGISSGSSGASVPATGDGFGESSSVPVFSPARSKYSASLPKKADERRLRAISSASAPAASPGSASAPALLSG